MRADRATADPAKDMMKRAERSTSARGGHGIVVQLLPLDNGAQEIRALDGLRACAALSVVLFHIFLVSHASLTFLGPDGALDWYYLMTGVHLFFVLSGFLMFLPFCPRAADRSSRRRDNGVRHLLR